MSNPSSSNSSVSGDYCATELQKEKQVSLSRSSSWRQLFYDTLVAVTRYSVKHDVVIPETVSQEGEEEEEEEEESDSNSEGEDDNFSQTSELTSWSSLGAIPSLNIVVMVVGTRGDVQPFIALGMELQKYGHRVRLASHKVYRHFVLESGLEFYPLGGDPTILIESLTRNKGIVAKSLRDIRQSRRYVKEVVFPSLDACISPDPGDPDLKSFKADVIIANPPAQGHIHCGEFLGIPVHIMFTMPWTPTQFFPHPMARIGRQNLANQMGYLSKKLRKPVGFQRNNSEEEINQYGSAGWANLFSYHVVDDFIWMGLGDIVNQFRRKLGLKPLYGAFQLQKMLKDRPWTYCWSPSLLPKPADWGPNIDVAGFFVFKSKQPVYRPPLELAKFLQAGPPPIFFGFGSLIFKRSKQINEIILKTVEKLGIRAIIQRGWCGLGGTDGNQFQNPDNVLYIDACPHDWLFPRCAAVVHHGGAGTTASGLLAGCPTMIVPFFGDQAFWGEACFNAGVGPSPISSDHLSEENLIESINILMDDEVRSLANKMQKQLLSENGLRNAVESIHQNLPVECIIRKDKYGTCAQVSEVTDDCDIEPCTLGSIRKRVVYQMYDLLTYRSKMQSRRRRRRVRQVYPVQQTET